MQNVLVAHGFLGIALEQVCFAMLFPVLFFFNGVRLAVGYDPYQRKNQLHEKNLFPLKLIEKVSTPVAENLTKLPLNQSMVEILCLKIILHPRQNRDK